MRSGFSYGVSLAPMTKSPVGTTTSSGQSWQSLKISPGSGVFPRATAVSGAGAGRSIGAAAGGEPGVGLMVSPRCACAGGLATAAATARKIRNNRREFMMSFPRNRQPNELSSDAQYAHHASFHRGRQGDASARSRHYFNRRVGSIGERADLSDIHVRSLAAGRGLHRSAKEYSCLEVEAERMVPICLEKSFH